MPIYEYRCQSCGAINEVWAKLSDPPPEACPDCGAAGQMEKLISRSAFHLKGGGWYAQGYEGGSKKGGSSSNDGSTSSSDSSTSSSDSSTSSSGSSTSSSGSSTSSGTSSSSD